MIDLEIAKPKLKKLLLFDALSDPQFRRLGKHSHKCMLRAGERLFSRDEQANFFYYLDEGKMKLFRASPDGVEKVLEIVEPGQIFAEAVMFMKTGNYPVNAESLTNCQLYAFSIPTFKAILSESTGACFRLLEDLSARLHRRIDDIDHLALKSATYRLIAYLLAQLPRTDNGSEAIHLDIPKQVLASSLSIQPETFSRILSKLVKEGFLSVSANVVTVKDVGALRKLL